MVATMTLKDWKAQFVVGAKFEVIDHWVADMVGSTREVVKVQGNGYWFHDNVVRTSNQSRVWSDWPKRNELTFNDNGTFTLRPLDIAHKNGFWTLRPIKSDVGCERCGKPATSSTMDGEEVCNDCGADLYDAE